MLQDKIENLKQEITALKAANKDELEAIRLKYLSKKGIISQLFNDFRLVPPEEKRHVGQLLNELKEAATTHFNALRDSIDNNVQDVAGIDLTRTAYPIPLGTRHPLSVVRNEICDIFAKLGFSIAEGPEIEDDWHVFSSLNFAPDHPARDMQDTFLLLAIPIFCCVHIRRRYKLVSWSIRNRLSASFAPGVFIATKLYRRAPTAFSIR